MPEQVKAERHRQEKPAEEPVAAKSQKERGDELKGEMDALLDEIDDALEENAEEFVASFIQKGGQAIRVMVDHLLRPRRNLAF